MNKVYCQDCEKYDEDNLPSFRTCEVVVDDYYSPTHTVKKDPRVLNVMNNCPSFKCKKSGKK